MATKLIPDQDLSVTLAPQMNILTNGGFEIWQRATTFSTPATGAYTADRWIINHTTAGGMAFTVSREATIVDNGYSAKIDVTNTGGGSQLCHFAQDVENWAMYLGKTISLSVRVKCNVTSCARILIHDGTNNTYSSYHTGDNTWQTLTLTVTMPVNATRLLLKIGAINNGDMQVSTTYFDSAMLVVGSLPVNFIPMHPADDLARCLRYYEKGFQRLTSAVSYEPAENIETGVVWKVTKFAAPTVTPSNRVIILIHVPTDGASGVSADSANWDNGSSDGISISECRTRFSRTGSQTTYNSALVTYNWVAEVT